MLINCQLSTPDAMILTEIKSRKGTCILARLYECTERAVALSPALALVVLTVALTKSYFCYFKVFFNVIGKALSGELSCTRTDLVSQPLLCNRVLGPVVQSIFSLTSSLRGQLVKYFTTS